MAAKKTPARASESARVRVRTSFNGLRKGDESDVKLTALVRAWIGMGLVEVVAGGTDPSGPGGTEPPAAGGAAQGAGDGGPAGDEQGESFGSGGYGAPSGVDQD
jgi:hypothetical protein